MFFSDYDTVVIAWSLNMYPFGSYLPEGHDLGGSGYDGRIRVGSYNVGSGSFDWILEQNKYFGHATSIAYHEWSPTEKNIYIGGAVDTARTDDNPGATENW